MTFDHRTPSGTLRELTEKPWPGVEARLISPADEETLRACWRLRFRYFVEERGWVCPAGCGPGEETDSYDPHCLHLAVAGSEGVAAYLRILPFNPAVGFMLDKELAAALSPRVRATLARENAVEISRLVRAPRASSSGERCHWEGDGITWVELLFKKLYHLSLERDFTLFYIVVEAHWLRPFARRFGLSFRVLGEPCVFPDGTQTVAAVSTREEFEASMRTHSRAKYEWYRDGL